WIEGQREAVEHHPAPEPHLDRVELDGGGETDAGGAAWPPAAGLFGKAHGWSACWSSPRIAARSASSSGSSSSRNAPSNGSGICSVGGSRLDSKPLPFSSSRPGRSLRLSRPKWSRKASVVP